MPERGLTGLTVVEVAERIRNGEVNRPPRSDFADYIQIVRRNLFTLFNAMSQSRGKISLPSARW